MAWPLLHGRCVDGAPTLRIPSCAGEYPSPLTSADTRLTEPRETGAHCPLSRTHGSKTQEATHRLDTASRFIQANMNTSGGGGPVRGSPHRDTIARYRSAGGVRHSEASACQAGDSHEDRCAIRVAGEMRTRLGLGSSGGGSEKMTGGSCIFVFGSTDLSPCEGEQG